MRLENKNRVSVVHGSSGKTKGERFLCAEGGGLL
jgi:hypothetical protein